MNYLSVAAFFVFLALKKGNFWENWTLVNKYLLPAAMVSKLCKYFLIFYHTCLHLTTNCITALLKIKNSSFWMGLFESKFFPLCCHGNNGKLIISNIWCNIKFSKFVNDLISFTLYLQKFRIKLKILSFQEMLNAYCQPLLIRKVVDMIIKMKNK